MQKVDRAELSNTTTYNISTVLRDHILKCGYFKNTLVSAAGVWRISDLFDRPQ